MLSREGYPQESIMDSRQRQRRRANSLSRRTHGPLVPLAALALVLLPLIGCDDKRSSSGVPPVPPPAPATQPAAPAVTRPTTQELLNGPRKPLVLGNFKLTMEVPPSWKLETVGSATWLAGETPNGEVRMQLAVQGAALKSGAINAMEKRARDEAAKEPDKLEVIPLHNIGGTARKMERREVLHNLELRVPKADGTTLDHVEHVDRMDWSILVFVPDGDQFTLEVINFSGLSIQQYEKDRTFLEGIIRSLHYDATGGALQ
jgi:hypothetical protein